MPRQILTDQAEEMKLAKQEGRQPVCVHCSEPLECIRQYQDFDIYWDWDKEKKAYIKTTDSGSADKPCCTNCETKDWDYIDHDLVDF